MQASEVHEWLRSLEDGWVDWDESVDGFIQGNPDTEVEGIAVGWMSYTWALERAADLGCNLFLTHEATYYDHFDEPAPNNFPEAIAEQVREKVELVDELGATILRSHDVWDEIPEIGVPDAWGQQLGFADEDDVTDEFDGVTVEGLMEPFAGGDYFRVYDLGDRTARDVAEQVARNTEEYGQEAVQLVGPDDASVSRVVIGTGALTPVQGLIDAYDPDMLVCSDDGFSYWTDTAIATDMGVPMVVVNHATAELTAIERLAEAVDEQFPEVPVHHIPQSCHYELVEP